MLCADAMDEAQRVRVRLMGVKSKQSCAVIGFRGEKDSTETGVHGRYSPQPAQQAPSLEFNPIDALRRIFPDVNPRDLEAGFDASARNIHATVAAFRARQAKDAAASRISRAAANGGGGMEDCASVLVDQMAAAADVADAKDRASWILAIIKDAVAERAAAALREENAALKTLVESTSTEGNKLREENAALKTQAATEANKLLKRGVVLLHARQEENAVLKRGVVLLHARQEEMTEMKKKMAELEMANYALTVRLRDADSCRFQSFRDAF